MIGLWYAEKMGKYTVAGADSVIWRGYLKEYYRRADRIYRCYFQRQLIASKSFFMKVWRTVSSQVRLEFMDTFLPILTSWLLSCGKRKKVIWMERWIKVSMDWIRKGYMLRDMFNISRRGCRRLRWILMVSIWDLASLRIHTDVFLIRERRLLHLKLYRWEDIWLRSITKVWNILSISSIAYRSFTRRKKSRTSQNAKWISLECFWIQERSGRWYRIRIWVRPWI